MNPIASLHPTSQAWLRNSALAPHIDAFAAHLESGRYATTTTKSYIAGIAHFARWMTQCCLPLQMLDEHGVDQFLSNHLARCDCPEIFNTDQGSQFTSGEFTGLLKEHGIQISMDGKGCWRDNVFVERLWRSIKYEEVYLHAYDSVSEAKTRLGTYIGFYNTRRPHQSLDGQTPDKIYFNNLPQERIAA